MKLAWVYRGIYMQPRAYESVYAECPLGLIYARDIMITRRLL